LEFGDVGFYEGRKTGEPGEKTLGASQEPTTNSTHIYGTEPESNQDHVVERGEFSSLLRIIKNKNSMIRYQTCPQRHEIWYF